MRRIPKLVLDVGYCINWKYLEDLIYCNVPQWNEEILYWLREHLECYTEGMCHDYFVFRDFNCKHDYCTVYVPKWSII